VCYWHLKGEKRLLTFDPIHHAKAAMALLKAEPALSWDQALSRIIGGG
jgi:hypothetical protein